MSLVEADVVTARLGPFRWAWAEENRDAIAASWARRVVERPALFNGRVLMVSALRVSGRAIDATFFATDYANLLTWLDAGRPGEPVWNGFAMGAMRGRDGAFLLGRMGAHTANAGRLYFPCGTPDGSDVTADGTVDLQGSIAREIAEETGFGPDDYAVEPGWTVVDDRGLLAFLRAVRLRLPSGEACARARAFIAAQPRSELSGIEVVTGPDEFGTEPVPGVVPIYLRHVMERGRTPRLSREGEVELAEPTG